MCWFVIVSDVSFVFLFFLKEYTVYYILFRLELHLIGGFDDDNKTSHNLSREILGMDDRIFGGIFFAPNQSVHTAFKILASYSTSMDCVFWCCSGVSETKGRNSPGNLLHYW